MVLVGWSAVAFVVLAVHNLFGPALTLPPRSFADKLGLLELAWGSLTAYGGLLLASIAVPMWAHRAYRNLPALGRRGHLSPGWAAAVWLIPIVNLALPWLVLHDLWMASNGPVGRRLPLPAMWAAAWLLAAALLVAAGSGSSRLAGVATLLQPLALALAGLLLVLTIRSITRAQESKPKL